jgi:two-component system sensor histidine kinase CpxA
MKLFLRIFLSFWIATALMIVAVIVGSSVWPTIFPGDQEKGFRPEQAEARITEIIAAYEHTRATGTQPNLSGIPVALRKSFYLFSEQGSLIVGHDPPPHIYSQLVEEVSTSGRAVVQRYGFSALFACPVKTPSGAQFIAVIRISDLNRRVLRLHFWSDVAVALPPAALVCLLLSLYLTRPITRLRATAQRLASGDLSARSSPNGSARRDEIGDLARDFDNMAAQIERLMTAQRRFVADVSHELGAPLTRLHLALALLRRQSGGQGSPALERIERETDKLSNLVQQLLLLAELEVGRLPAESMTPISLNTLCESIIEDANFEAEHANCVVVGLCQDVTLFAYPQLLRRAIDNVLRNAIRYAPSGSEINVNCRVDDDRRMVIVDVLDSGPGVPESMLSDIFRPFFRTSPGRESETGGTGLGLAIATEAVRLHDGAIIAQNRESGGLQVTIALPLRMALPHKILIHAEQTLA